MENYKVVHYINQFFAGIGGEEKADIKPEIKEGAVGPGMALEKALGDGYEIAATVICGDNYFGENLEAATDAIIEMVKQYEPDVFVAGPAFNAGRYGVACGTICKAVEEKLGVPVVTAQYGENPGVDMFRKDMIIVKTGDSSAKMRTAIPALANIVRKLAAKEEILGPDAEGYHERGIRVNYFAEERASERAIQMLVKKMKGEEFETDLQMPKFDRVDPALPIKDMKHAKLAVVTSGGIVPTGNPDHIESSSATKFGVYSIENMDTMSPKDFTTIHGGYDRQFVMENPNLVVPLDVLREMEKDGEFGELANYFYTTTGTGTATGSAARFGDAIGQRLVEDHVDGVILVST